MNHKNIKSYSEFSLNEGKFFNYLSNKYDIIKRWIKRFLNGVVGSVKEGAERAEMYLEENSQILEQMLLSINNLSSSEKSQLLSIKPLINSFTGNQEEVDKILGPGVLESEESKIESILRKIGEWTGTGLLLLSVFGGIITFFHGVISNMPLLGALGFIVFLIGVGINSMTGDRY